MLNKKLIEIIVMDPVYYCVCTVAVAVWAFSLGMILALLVA